MPATTMMHDSLLSLCKVSGSGYVLGFCRVFAESLARVMCLASAESSQSLRLGLCAPVLPSLRRPHPEFLFTIKPRLATATSPLVGDDPS